MIFVYTKIRCVRAGRSTLITISDALVRYIFCRKMKKTRPMGAEMDGNMFISRQSRYFFVIVNIIEVFFRMCTSTWRVNNYVSHQGKAMKRWNERSLLYEKYKILNITLTISWLYRLRQIVGHIFIILSIWLTIKKYFSHHYCWAFLTSKDGNAEKSAKVGSRFKRNTRRTS